MEEAKDVKVKVKHRPKAPAKPKIVHEELVRASYTEFGVSPEVMKAALKGEEALTVDEAQMKLNAFLTKGVK